MHIIDGKVIMQKYCCDHGRFESVVESSADYWIKCQMSNDRSIYGGHFIDVTRRCNLKCRYCYYPVDNKSEDRIIESIIQEAQFNHGAERFILTGGEPTLREDLFDIIDELQKIKPVELLTNGVNLTMPALSMLSKKLAENRGMRINLSIHDEAEQMPFNVLKNFREMGLKIESILVVIDRLEQIDDIIELCRNWSDVIASVRIKAATNIWAEKNANKKIFVSEMLAYMLNRGAVSNWWRNNKTSFFNVDLDGIIYMLVSWYDVENIDLLDINCPPTYTSIIGNVENIVTAMIVNEGFKKGFLNGVSVWDS